MITCCFVLFMSTFPHKTVNTVFQAFSYTWGYPKSSKTVSTNVWKLFIYTSVLSCVITLSFPMQGGKWTENCPAEDRQAGGDIIRNIFIIFLSACQVEKERDKQKQNRENIRILQEQEGAGPARRGLAEVWLWLNTAAPRQPAMNPSRSHRPLPLPIWILYQRARD